MVGYFKYKIILPFEKQHLITHIDFVKKKLVTLKMYFYSKLDKRF